jgi:hypothetical protein
MSSIVDRRSSIVYPFIRIKGYIERSALSNAPVAVLCALGCLCAADARAQDVIDWSPDARLAIRDFQGRPPVNAAGASLSWLNVEAEWECQAGALFATARATFDPSRSWWRGSRMASIGARRSSARRARAEAERSVVQFDLQLLEHEQLHFDIAELAARKLRARFDAFKDACDEQDDSERIRKMVADIDREMYAEQQRYDRETAHGINVRAQDHWRKRIRALLQNR